MAYLLDTNILSETIRKVPEPRLMSWLETQTPTELFVASQSIGELIRGAHKLIDTTRRKGLLDWIERDLFVQFDDRLLPFDYAAASIWGRLMGEGDRIGRTPSAQDAQIAAVAIQRGLVVVTRNEKDFAAFEVPLLNPWTHRA